MNRRLFLKFSSSLLASTGFVSPLILHPRRLLANSQNTDHFFVLVQIANGWDVTLSLDPKTHQPGHDQKDMFIEYQEDEILQAGELLMGPAFQPMVSHSADLHIIRGINMRRDAGHFTNLEIMSSGYGDGQSALIPVELSVATQSGPLGVLINSSIATGTRSAILTEVSSISNGSSLSDIMGLLEIGDDDSTFSQAQLGLQQVDGKMLEIQQNLDQLNQQGVGTDEARAMMASFLARAAFQGSLHIRAELDTHSSHEGAHMSEQTRAWQEVSDLFNAFKAVEYGNGESLFDRTTFMVVSEFARTSALNSSAGKDHNPLANSILLAGRGVQGGKASGESFVIGVEESRFGVAEHISYPIDYSTGQVIKTAQAANDNTHLIFPENVSATVGAIFGSPERYYAEQSPARVIPGIVKNL